ncbi:MAG: type I-E CRISPR-associated protein Cas6/Cse3/CasE [Meiothermus sp.]|nr:type I-E CRISPR-associated protein Cas6/Cse3/CasE [Meiothermus sp.]
MFLSKLVLNPGSKQARTDLASPYQLHATLCRAFVPKDQISPRFLWRLEEIKTPQVLVQSPESPNWEILFQRFPGYFAQAPGSKPLPLEHLQPAQTLRFRLKANPTVTKQSKRHGLKEMAEQLEWLNRQGEKGGFRVLGAMVAQSERVKMHKHASGSPIVVQSVLYEGHLKIADLESFKRTLATGLGHAKALGFGLLSVAKG